MHSFIAIIRKPLCEFNIFALQKQQNLGCGPFQGSGSVFVDSLLIVSPIEGFWNCSMFRSVLFCVHFKFCNYPDRKEKAGCFALFVFLVSRDSFVALPHGATVWPAVCDCGISSSYSLN